jgi:hypothetical protein
MPIFRAVFFVFRLDMRLYTHFFVAFWKFWITLISRRQYFSERLVLNFSAYNFALITVISIDRNSITTTNFRGFMVVTGHGVGQGVRRLSSPFSLPGKIPKCLTVIKSQQ